MVGLARWWRQAGNPENALALFRQAVDRGLPDDLMFRTLWDTALIEKKLGRQHAALPVFTELASARNPWRAAALEELAKYFEHRERNYPMALEMTLNALDLEPSEALRRRVARLKKKSGDRILNPLISPDMINRLFLATLTFVCAAPSQTAPGRSPSHSARRTIAGYRKRQVVNSRRSPGAGRTDQRGRILASPVRPASRLSIWATLR